MKFQETANMIPLPTEAQTHKMPPMEALLKAALYIERNSVQRPGTGQYSDTESAASSSSINRQSSLESSGSSDSSPNKRKPYICTYSHCLKSFASPSHLERHVRVHTGLKPFSCEVCRKGFSRKDNLNQHMKIHKF